jgi:hypothetical protein
MKIVTLRGPDTGRVFDRDATRVGMVLPSEWPDDAAVTVTGRRPGMDPAGRRARSPSVGHAATGAFFFWASAASCPRSAFRPRAGPYGGSST